MPEEGNYFINVEATIRNEGSQPEVVSTLLQMEIRDSEGRSYHVDFSAIAASGNASLDGEIGPGSTLRGEVGFQLPTDRNRTDLAVLWRHFPVGTSCLFSWYSGRPSAAARVCPRRPSAGRRSPHWFRWNSNTRVGILEDARQQVAGEDQFNDRQKKECAST